VGSLRTAHRQKTSQVLGPCHAKVLLGSGEMTSDDNDLAMALSSCPKDLGDRIHDDNDDDDNRRHADPSVSLPVYIPQDSPHDVAAQECGCGLLSGSHDFQIINCRLNEFSQNVWLQLHSPLKGSAFPNIQHP